MGGENVIIIIVVVVVVVGQYYVKEVGQVAWSV